MPVTGIEPATVARVTNKLATRSSNLFHSREQASPPNERACVCRVSRSFEFNFEHKFEKLKIKYAHNPLLEKQFVKMQHSNDKLKVDII